MGYFKENWDLRSFLWKIFIFLLKFQHHSQNHYPWWDGNSISSAPVSLQVLLFTKRSLTVPLDTGHWCLGAGYHGKESELESPKGENSKSRQNTYLTSRTLDQDPMAESERQWGEKHRSENIQQQVYQKCFFAKQMAKHSPRLAVLQGWLQAETKWAATKCNSTAPGTDCHDCATCFANAGVWMSQTDAGEGGWMLCSLCP